MFYADEVDIDLNPKIGFLWSTQGCQRAIPTPGQNRKRYLAGALHARTGRVAYVEGTRKKQRPIPLPARPPAANLPRRASNILIVDNYIIHKCRLAHVWLKHNPKFRLLFQPAYQPWVNDIEKLWKQLHDKVTRNHRYSTIDRLMDAVRAFMRAASPFPGNCRVSQDLDHLFSPNPTKKTTQDNVRNIPISFPTNVSYCNVHFTFIEFNLQPIHAHTLSCHQLG